MTESTTVIPDLTTASLGDILSWQAETCAHLGFIDNERGFRTRIEQIARRLEADGYEELVTRSSERIPVLFRPHTPRLDIKDIMKRVVVGGRRGSTSLGIYKRVHEYSVPNEPYLVFDVDLGEELCNQFDAPFPPSIAHHAFERMGRKSGHADWGVFIAIYTPDFIDPDVQGGNCFLDLPGSKLERGKRFSWFHLQYWTDERSVGEPVLKTRWDQSVQGHRFASAGKILGFSEIGD